MAGEPGGGARLWARIDRRLPYLAMVLVSLDMARRQTLSIGGKHYVVLFDDAMISMRYARNLAHGYGLVHNVGQRPVEGYTNPLWTLWMAVLHLAPVPDRLVSGLVIGSGLVILLANLALVECIAHRLAPDSPLTTQLALWLTALCVPVVLWTVLGMEVGLVALAISGAVLLCLRWHEHGRRSDLYLLAGVLALATLIRPDATVAAVVIVAYAVARAGPESRTRALVVLLGALGAALVAQTTARLAYYGQALPNTYYLKVTGIGLRTRVKRGVLHLVASGLHQFYVPLLLALGWVASPGSRKQRAPYLLLAIVVAQFGYSVYVGGDSYDGGEASSRYLAVVLPVLLIVAALGVGALASLPQRTRRWGVAVATPVLVGVAALRAANAQPGLSTQLGPTPAGSMGWRVGPPLFLLVLLWIVLLVGERHGAATEAPAGVREPTTPGPTPAAATADPAGAHPTARREPTRRPATTRLATLGLAVAVVVAFSAQDLNHVLRQPSGADRFDNTMTRLAVAVRAATDGKATLATGADGELGYFSGLRIVDILGYTDQRIAHLPPATSVFIPGHDKWDLAYSIGELHPDLVIGTVFGETAQQRAQILSYGYDLVGPEFYVSRTSTHVNRVALAAAARLVSG